MLRSQKKGQTMTNCFGISLKYFASGLFRIITQPTASPWFWRAAIPFSEDKEVFNHKAGKSNEETQEKRFIRSQLSVTEAAPGQPVFRGHSKTPSLTQPNFFLWPERSCRESLSAFSAAWEGDIQQLQHLLQPPEAFEKRSGCSRLFTPISISSGVPHFSRLTPSSWFHHPLGTGSWEHGPNAQPLVARGTSGLCRSHTQTASPCD